MDEAAIAAIAAELGAAGNAAFAGIWPQHVAAVDAFLAGASQWRTASEWRNGRVSLVFVGLDYAGLTAAWAASGLAVAAAEFRAVQAIEAGARAALNGEEPPR